MRKKELSFYIWGEPVGPCRAGGLPAAPLLGERAVCRPSTGRQVTATRKEGGRLPPGVSAQKKIIFIYM